MTQCTKQLLFPFFKGSKLTASFDGGSITSDGGLLLVREFDERIGLSERFSKLIPDPRDLRFILHDQDVLIRQVPPQEMPLMLAAADAAISFAEPRFSKIASSPTKIAEYRTMRWW